MNVVVNGNPHVLRGEKNLASLIEELGARTERVAVMVNDAIVPREKWSRTPVIEGDRIEVLTFMGGGG
jgi:thiamine biosynthesis protein ThiS